MIQKIKKNLLLSLSAFFVLAVPLAVPTAVLAADPPNANATIQGSLCGGATDLKVDSANQTAGTTCDDTNNGGETKVNKLIKQIINVFSVIVGVVAVIMIIFAGFKYITSGGKEEGVKTAKNTILYALIGLVIVALAQIIVKFVLNKATT